MGTTVNLGSSHINLESQGQGDTTDHLSSIAFVRIACRRAHISLYTQGHHATLTESSR